MRAVIAVDWSDQAFNAVQVTCRLFAPKHLTIVHGVDTRPFETSTMALPIASQAAAQLRQSLVEAGEKLLQQTAGLVPATMPAPETLHKFGNPADVIIDTAKDHKADLVAIGTRGRGRVAEMFLGSVSQRVVQHTQCANLIVRQDPGPIRRVVVASEGMEDGHRLRDWLLLHPFAERVELVLVSVVPVPFLSDPLLASGYASWSDHVEKAAHAHNDQMAEALRGQFTIGEKLVLKGDPADQIARVAENAQLVVIGTHGRKGMERFLLGSVSHAVLHHVSCPVLLIRS